MRFMAGAAVALLFAATVAAVPARADIISSSSINGPGAVSNNGASSSSAYNSRGEFISSYFSTVGGIANMGAAYTVAANGDQEHWPYALSSTENDDSWDIICTSTAPCESEYSDPIPVSIAVSFNGTFNDPAVEGENGASIQATYDLGSLDFSLNVAQASGLGLEGDAEWCGTDGTCTDTPIDFVSNGDGTYSFSYSDTMSTVVCQEGCPIVTYACTQNPDCASTNIGFTDMQEIYASVYDNNYDYFADASDPFSINLISDDPDYELISAAGRVSGTPSPTPEPGSLGLLGSALGLLALLYRRSSAASQRCVLAGNR